MYVAGYRVVHDAYAAWKRGDLTAFGRLLADDVDFTVPTDARTFIGSSRGKLELLQRIKSFLRSYDVLRYEVLIVMLREDFYDCRVEYTYQAKATGWDIDGIQRHKWKVTDGRITYFEVIHDAKRLGAFFEMVDNAADPAFA